MWEGAGVGDVPAWCHSGGWGQEVALGLLGCTGGAGETGLCWAWGSSLNPPPQNLLVDKHPVPGALWEPHPPGCPRLHGSHPKMHSQPTVPFPRGGPSPLPTHRSPQSPLNPTHGSPQPHIPHPRDLSSPTNPILPGTIPTCSERSAPRRMGPEVPGRDKARAGSALPGTEGAVPRFPSLPEGERMAGGGGQAAPRL